MNIIYGAASEVETTELFTGKIEKVQYDIILSDYVAWLDLKGKKIAIPRQELELHELKGTISNYIGKIVEFSITEYDHYREVYFASCRPVKEKRQAEITTLLKKGHVMEARIIKLVYFGAYLAIDSLTVILRNCDFSSDYTAVGDIYRKGERLNVKIKKVSQNGKINVQAIPKYENPHHADLEDFQPQTVVQGVVRNVKSWACFVNVAPNLDAICPVPSHLDIYEGMKVAFRINQVRQSDRKIRGKIIRSLD